MDTGIQGYRDTGIQEYKEIGIQGYRDTRIQEYKDTRIQSRWIRGYKDMVFCIKNTGTWIYVQGTVKLSLHMFTA